MDEAPESLEQTPLNALHRRLGATLVPFAGYEMPLHYPLGLLREHRHTRSAAGLFDVSHMGQIVVAPLRGTMADAALSLESLVPADILGLAPGRQRYGVFTDDRGGVLDDLMIANLGDRFVLVVNASRKAADEAHLRAHLADRCRIAVLPDALIALQGPAAERALRTVDASGALGSEIARMTFLDVREISVFGAPCLVSRSGYTGEDGFEISVPADVVADLASRLLADESVEPAGLGARDSLRLEAGLPLHGADIDATTSPTEAALGWAVGQARRAGGARAGGFPGAACVLAEIETGASRLRVGLRAEGRGPVRAGAPLFADEGADAGIGMVTSGGFGPSVGAPVAMGYLPRSFAAPGTRVVAEVRGARVPLRVATLPFVPSRVRRTSIHP